MKKLPHPQEKSIQHASIAGFRIAMDFYSVHRRKVEGGWEYPLHDHPLFELNMALEGEQHFLVDGREIIVGAGDILLLKPGESHSCSTLPGRGMTYLCIHFGVDEPELKLQLGRIGASLHGPGSPLREALYPLLVNLGAPGTMERDIGNNKMKSLSLCLELISALSRLLADPPEGFLREAGRSDRLAMDISEKIAALASQQQLLEGDDLMKQGIAGIARELGYSPAYCTRLFKTVYGVSPRQYLSTVKLREAQLLLLNRELAMEQIAERLGFRDAAHFSKQFKRWTKLSPSEYRHMH
ncbi:MAG: AraC/XylS family transcriptional regulator [Paenibacillaceae bacterium]|jgi:AraC-like DNA-binding protein/mannose-6-phosphate isomerase-like protein (cupin superfamily)|nr:AraC/XylS family transcriptional regulator [Paenibacillaceae bacterium]